MVVYGVIEKGGIRSVQLGEVRVQKRGEFFCDIVVYVLVFLFFLSGIQVEIGFCFIGIKSFLCD